MYKYRRVIISVIALLLAGTMLAGLLVSVFAVSSSEIRSEIDSLENKADSLAEEREKLEDEISANQNKTLSLVEQKSQIDRDIELTRREVENLNEQIQQYNLLIAEKQADLDQLRNDQDTLLEHYKLRIRAMQERGDVSYWEVIFEAKSFSDMLNRVAMVEEIALSDQRMMEEMRSIAADVLAAKESLAAEKVSAEEKKTELAAAEDELAEKRAEADAVLAELVSDAEQMKAEIEKFEKLEEELTSQIAQKEKEYTEAKREEERPVETQPSSGGSGGGSEGGESGGSGGSGGSTSSYFRYPLPASAGSWVSCPYGYRIHPVTGNHSFHNGVDLAANQGTPIYATKSGTVTTATYSSGYGYYVTINHGDGFSSLYGHMTHYTVSSGEYVDQGEVIGYVGSTGVSTGPHLHFTLFYNGSTVNPMNYVSVP